MPARISVWVVTTILVAISVLGVGLAVFGAMYTSVNNQQQEFYQSIGTTVNRFMIAGVNRLLDNLYEASLSVYYSEPLIATCTMPNSSYNPERIIRLFDSLSTDPSRQLESIGFLMHASGTSNGKVSWEIAYGFGCPDYIYAYADPASYPAFIGYCASDNATISWNSPAYSGTDWGLKPQENSLLANNATVGTTIHLSIFALLDRLTLTVEHSIGCSGTSVYGAVFAEQSLSQLDASLATVTEQGIVAFIIESATGYLIASSIPNQTQVVNITTGAADRVLASQASSDDIKSIYYSGSDWWIETSNIVSGDISWTLVCGIPKSSFINIIQQIDLTSIFICLGIVFGVTLVAALVAYFFISRPLRTLSQRLSQETTLEKSTLLSRSHVEEIAKLEDLISM